MMIFKSIWRQKPLLKSQKYRTCHADRGLRSGTPRWGYPSHRYRGVSHSDHETADGYDAPKAPAGRHDQMMFSPWPQMIVTTDEFCSPSHQTPPYTKKGLWNESEASSVEIDGVEPTTLCLQSRCSSQLSYIPKICRPEQIWTADPHIISVVL